MEWMTRDRGAGRTSIVFVKSLTLEFFEHRAGEPIKPT
jgi:hypothetical protein